VAEEAMERAALINTREAAQWLGVSVSFLNRMRCTGGGPLFARLQSKVMYDPADLAAWVASRKRRSTSEFDQTVKP
jgi:hypothetical protein